MLFYNLETMRYEIVGDKRSDLLAEKLSMDVDYEIEEPAENDELY